MKAVQFTSHGGPEVLTYEPYPHLSVGDMEARIDIKAAATNHLDLWTRRGLPGVDLELPHIPGSDMAGIISEVGSSVTGFSVGDRVALVAGITETRETQYPDGDPTLTDSFEIIGEHRRGVHAEETVVPASNLIKVPHSVSWDVAGSAALVFQTAWRMIVEKGSLRPGETVLIHGASGGVGHAAVQIADMLGATVLATGSTQHKLAYAAECGADTTINYESEEFRPRVFDVTDGDGVDMVIDHVGAATYTDSLKCLRKGGRFVTCGATTGGDPPAGLNRIFWNQLKIIGSTMAAPAQAREVLSHVWDGTLTPRIRARLPMSEIAEAHRLLNDREGFGKVVVIPDSEY